ncbi:MAG: c-type cytochrome biogenesis protein CcmI [Proteobacteria bacterium]|nr:c-type cytochrome biogenesis protein CcmI [Pseudomonadota bacterium]NOG59314.1 c-type cytochrome biogenesis protein CcmI [Pseudomonadota bacterium]
MIFMLLTLAIAVISVIFLLKPLLSSKENQTAVERNAVNVESAATRLAELKQDFENGLIDKKQLQNYQLEIETAALEDLRNVTSLETQGKKFNKAIAFIVALAVPIFSFLVYQQLGSEAAFDSQLQTDESAIASHEIEKMLAAVEKEVLENPDDVEGRVALAQVYVEMERYTDAATVYRELNKLRPDEPDVLVNYAEALARSHGNRLTGKPTELLNQALNLEPKHGRALWLAGFAEQQADNKDAALTHWRNLMTGMEEDSDVYKHLSELISELENSESAPVTVVTNESSDDKQSIQVKVSLLPELQSKIDPDTTMFIYARASEGPPMPLAVHKGLAKDLPITVTLDDSMAMMPQMSLSKFPQIVVGARLSSNGQPQGQSGDYEGFSEVIEISNNPIVDILINSVKP